MKQKFFMLAAALIVAVAASAAKQRTYKVAQFAAIKCSGAASVVYNIGNQYSVKAVGEQDDIDQYVVANSGGTLLIQLKKKHRNNVGKVLFTVSAPLLNSLDLSGAATFSAKTVKPEADFDLDMSGASKAEIKQLTLNGHLDLDASGASKMVLTGAADEVQLDQTGVSKYDTSGLNKF